jgi:hypothetical protein
VIATQVVSAKIARRNRRAALQDKLRDAISAMLELRGGIRRGQKDFFIASSDYWDGPDKQAALPVLFAERDAYYQACDEIQRAITGVRFLTNDKQITAALRELGGITDKGHREDPGKNGRADDGVDSNRELQERTDNCFNKLEEATRKNLSP